MPWTVLSLEQGLIILFRNRFVFCYSFFSFSLSFSFRQRIHDAFVIGNFRYRYR